VRVVIADDNLLVREGVASLLRRAGIDVAAEAGDAEGLLRAVADHGPDVAIVDIRMPPTQTDEGLRAAQEIRARHPAVAIVILSQHVDLGTATRVLAEDPVRLGYLLKDRVTDIDDFVDTLERVAAGGSALDPDVVVRLLAAGRDEGPLTALTAREREVLQLVAEGRSNRGIADRLGVSERAVQKHVTSIFARLDLPAAEDDNRRILAVLAFLRCAFTYPGTGGGSLSGASAR
jgi:DNA-binding NarL/FixJ family response regulator